MFDGGYDFFFFSGLLILRYFLTEGMGFLLIAETVFHFVDKSGGVFPFFTADFGLYSLSYHFAVFFAKGH